MLVDIRFDHYTGYDHETRHHRQYALTDSEFGTVLVDGPSNTGSHQAACAGAVILEYSKRGLNVPANLARLLVVYYNKYDSKWASLPFQIDMWVRDQPLFTPKLKAELDKYLALC